MYGRARRLEAMKKFLLAISIVVVIFLSFIIFYSIFNKKDDNVEFAYLAKYLRSKGFSCELLKYSGSTCNLKGENRNEAFIRYDEGFNYLIRTDSYSIDLYHVDGEERITFKTTNLALSEYRGKKYICEYDNIIGTLEKCVLEGGTDKLDMQVYVGSIESAMNELSMILKSSGYDIDVLLNDYKWQKKD